MCTCTAYTHPCTRGTWKRVCTNFAYRFSSRNLSSFPFLRYSFLKPRSSLSVDSSEGNAPGPSPTPLPKTLSSPESQLSLMLGRTEECKYLLTSRNILVKLSDEDAKSVCIKFYPVFFVWKSLAAKKGFALFFRQIRSWCDDIVVKYRTYF